MDTGNGIRYFWTILFSFVINLLANEFVVWIVLHMQLGIESFQLNSVVSEGFYSAKI